MDEEMIKIKYRNLLNKLYIIKNEYNEIENVYDDLNRCLKENLLIDDKNVVDDTLSLIEDSNNALKEELSNNIIPTVSSRT